MKIISKFKDYYDSGMALGIDETIHYVRTQEDHSIIDDTLFKYIIGNGWSTSYNLPKGFLFDKITPYCCTLSILLFCGRAIPILMMNYKIKSTSYFGTDTEKVKYVIGIEEINRLKEHAKDKYNKNIITDIDSIMNNFTNSYVIEQHVKYQSPIIYIVQKYRDNFNLSINHKLKDIDFYKFKDVYTAFQDISMFLGSTLCDVSTPQMPVGDDKVILNSKGFDPKYGFRPRPKN
jgi:hypothetical protein